MCVCVLIMLPALVNTKLLLITINEVFGVNVDNDVCINNLPEICPLKPIGVEVLSYELNRNDIK